MMLPITAIYAGLLVFVFLALGIAVGTMRGKTGISIYDGGNMDLATRIRRHGNFSEFVPFALVLMIIIELNGANATLLHGLGIGLLLARIAHPIGLQHDSITHPLRTIGAMGTILVIVIAGCTALFQAFSR